MKKILIGGAGGAPSENVIKSIKESKTRETIIGIGSEPYDLMMSYADKKYQVPYAKENRYKERLLQVLNLEKVDLVHFQNDLEVLEASRIREDIMATGTKIFMPKHSTIEKCIDKSQTYEIWEKAGIKLPKTIKVYNEEDLKQAFGELGDEDGMIWLRATVGAGGKGALPTNNYDFARLWIERYQGWGEFTAAELLSADTVAWLSIWYEGRLVVAQTRKRRAWNYGNRTLSGVTGITKVGETYSDKIVNEVAIKAILAVDSMPHGIFGVDMTYDKKGIPNPTEINISRFFTTVYFFTKAGLNMPEIYKDIALYGEFPDFERKVNPLPDGLLWIRGMDKEPVLTTEHGIREEIELMDTQT